MRIFLLSLLFLLITLPAQAGGKVLDVRGFKSKDGIEAWLLQDSTVPVIAISFSFEGGLAYDPEDKPGVGRLVSILLDEGAGNLDSQQFQSQLANSAISLSFSAGRDAFYGQLKTLRENKEAAFDLLHLALTAPRFDKDAITRMKNANISQIKDDSGNPEWLVARSFNGMIFEGHAYARPGYGNLASMQSITRDDLVQFTKDQFAKEVLKVAIVGDITEEEAKRALDKIFGTLPVKADPLNTSEAPISYAGKTILLPLDTPQTFISIGQKAISHLDQDWHAAIIMNHILGGGGFGTRLMEEIREKRGLTYGVYSALNSMDHAALIQANMSCGNEKTEEALKILREQWDKFTREGPTEQEVADAKSYLTGSLLLSLTSTGDIADTLNSLQRDNLGINYINDRNSLINAVTAEDVRRVAARILKAEELTTILVGQPKNIKADILLDKPPGMETPRE